MNKETRMVENLIAKHPQLKDSGGSHLTELSNGSRAAARAGVGCSSAEKEVVPSIPITGWQN
jgi:hypothetical protein